jgi:hypothetical protein
VKEKKQGILTRNNYYMGTTFFSILDFNWFIKIKNRLKFTGRFVTHNFAFKVNFLQPLYNSEWQRYPINKSIITLKFLLMTGFILAGLSGLKAGTITSTSTGGEWSTGTTWIGGTAPAASDEVVIAAGATVTIGTNQGCAGITIYGTLSISAGVTLIITGDFTNTATFNAGTGEVLFDGTDYRHDQHIYGSATFNKLTVNNSGGYAVYCHNNIIVNNTMTISGNSILDMNDKSLSGGSNFAPSGTGWLKTQNTGGSPVPSGKTWSFGIEYNAEGNQSVAKGTYSALTISGSGTKNLPSAPTTTINGNFTLNGSATAVANGVLTIAGDVVLNSGTFVPAAHSHSVSGNWTNNGATFNPASGSIIFNSTSASQTINGTASSQTFWDILIIKIAQSLIIGGNTSTLKINKLTNTSGIFNAGSATIINVKDWWKNSGTFESSNCTVVFSGTSNQTINGTCTFNNLTVNNNYGVSITSEGITINGVLNLASNNVSASQGSLNTGDYVLNMGPTASTTGPGDVTGIVGRSSFKVSTEYTFGSRNTSLLFSADLEAEVRIRISSGTAPSTGSVMRKYELYTDASEATSAAIKLHYLDGELNSNTENLLSLFYNDGSALSELGRSENSTSDNYVSISGVDIINYSATSYDFEGNTRYITFDNSAGKGSLTWNGSLSSDWYDASNWTRLPLPGIPGPLSDVIIPDAGNTDYDPSLPSSSAEISSLAISEGGIFNVETGKALTCNNLAISSNAVLTVSDNSYLTVNGTLTNSNGPAGLSVEPGGQLIYNGTAAAATVKLGLSSNYSGNPPYYFHFFNPPVSSINIGNDVSSVRTALGLASEFGGDLLGYFEDLAAARTDQNKAWSYFDGWIPEGSTYYQDNPFTVLNSSRGYNIYLRAPGTISFKGTLNTGHTFILSRKGIGWNLIGNPYPCAFNLASITALTETGKDLDKTIYINYNGEYAVANIRTGDRTNWPSGWDNNVTVPPMQGFFVHTYTDGMQMPFPAEGKILSEAGTVAKNGILPFAGTLRKIKLSINYPDGSDEMIIGMADDATNTFDPEYDAFKLDGNSDTAPAVCSELNSVKYAINYLPESACEGAAIPLRVVLKKHGTYKIDVIGFENLNGVNAVLKHGAVETNLGEGRSYSFTSDAGTFTDFAIIIGNSMTGMEKPLLSAENLKAWYSNSYINIDFPDDIVTGIATLTVYDVQGKPVYRNNNLSAAPGRIIQIPVNLKEGLCFGRLILNSKAYILKITVNGR